MEFAVSTSMAIPVRQGGIAQAFATVPGEQYLVSFDLAGNPADDPVIKTMRVSADGQFQDFVFDITGKSFTDMGWTPQTWSFIADDSSATLAFNSLDVVSGWGPALDNVSVVPMNAVVPEPSSSVLVVVGVTVLVTLRWRRRFVE